MRIELLDTQALRFQSKRLAFSQHLQKLADLAYILLAPGCGGESSQAALRGVGWYACEACDLENDHAGGDIVRGVAECCMHGVECDKGTRKVFGQTEAADDLVV